MTIPEVAGGAQFEAVICFMQNLASELNETVVLTPENAPESVLFRATPGGAVECCVENYPM